MELPELEFWVKETIKYRQSPAEDIEELC